MRSRKLLPALLPLLHSMRPSGTEALSLLLLLAPQLLLVLLPLQLVVLLCTLLLLAPLPLLRMSPTVADDIVIGSRCTAAAAAAATTARVSLCECTLNGCTHQVAKHTTQLTGLHMPLQQRHLRQRAMQQRLWHQCCRYCTDDLCKVGFIC